MQFIFYLALFFLSFFCEVLKNRTDSPLYESTLYPETGRNFHITGNSCQLSFRGLPCPNLGTGGYAYHGPYEHISVEGMDMCVDIVVELIKLYTEGC